MRHITLLFLLFIASLTCFAQQKTRKVVFIIADGIPADLIEKADAPHLKRIARIGGYSRAYVGGEKGGYSQTPTISANGYNSLLTATWVNKHNVWGNEIKSPDYNYWTIFRFFKSDQPSKKIGIFSTWTDNRTKLVGESLAQTGNIKFDYVYNGYEMDTSQFPHDKQSMYTHLIDERVAGDAAKCIKENAPDLSWVYLEYSDDMGHRYGNSPQMTEAIGYVDEQVGKIWDAIEYRQKNFNEDWLIIVTTDHGRDDKTGRNHGGQSERERTTWIFTNAKGLNGEFQGKAAIVDINPSIARFLQIRIPEERLREMDGVSFIGSISVSSPSAYQKGDSLFINWKPWNEREMHGSGIRQPTISKKVERISISLQAIAR
ncbi:MAG TPA: alkaline phosphatase family protein [Puia sp.]|jgi:predicted AlkP superfamily pyrophosphatase or phosphodiesterase|nr:alkaline phosphatase family protein [Puia sp.]